MFMLCYSWLWSGEGLRIAVGDLMVYTCGLIGTRWGSLQVMVAFGRGKERNRSEKHTVGGWEGAERFPHRVALAVGGWFPIVVT